MPLILSQKPSYSWPVVYDAPRGSGKYDRSEFSAEFKRLPQSRLDQLHEQAKQKALDDRELIDEVLLGWEGIKDLSGEDVAFNEINKTVLLELTGMRAAIIRAFFGSVMGET